MQMTLHVSERSTCDKPRSFLSMLDYQKVQVKSIGYTESARFAIEFALVLHIRRYDVL